MAIAVFLAIAEHAVHATAGVQLTGIVVLGSVVRRLENTDFEPIGAIELSQQTVSVIDRGRVIAGIKASGWQMAPADVSKGVENRFRQHGHRALVQVGIVFSVESFQIGECFLILNQIFEAGDVGFGKCYA